MEGIIKLLKVSNLKYSLPRQGNDDRGVVTNNDVTSPSDWVLAKSEFAQTRVPRSTFTPVIVFAGCYSLSLLPPPSFPRHVVRTRYATIFLIVFFLHIDFLHKDKETVSRHCPQLGGASLNGFIIISCRKWSREELLRGLSVCAIVNSYISLRRSYIPLSSQDLGPAVSSTRT